MDGWWWGVEREVWLRVRLQSGCEGPGGCLLAVTDSKFGNLVSKVRWRRKKERRGDREMKGGGWWGGGTGRVRQQGDLGSRLKPDRGV